MGTTARIKTINELVNEGYEVSLYSSELIIQKGKKRFDIGTKDFDELEGLGTFNCKKDEGTWYKVDGCGYYGDGIDVESAFLTDIDDLTIFEIKLKCGDEIEVTKDGSIYANGSESLDKKQALELAKAVLIANGYDVD